MEDADINACMAKLFDVLGVKVSLGDPLELLSDDDEDVQPIAAVQKPTLDQNIASKYQGRASKSDSNAPIKFRSHDVGPRPCTDGAFDQKYQVGEPAEKEMEFCPWKVVTDYPDHFIGKTNRPHVCHSP